MCINKYWNIYITVADQLQRSSKGEPNFQRLKLGTLNEQQYLF